MTLLLFCAVFKLAFFEILVVQSLQKLFVFDRYESIVAVFVRFDFENKHFVFVHIPQFNGLEIYVPLVFVIQSRNVVEFHFLPFLIGTYEQEAAVMVSEEWMALRERANRDLESVTIISMTEFGMRQFATINKPIETIDDIKGLKIRSIGSPVIDEALQLVGANPVNITYSDLYSALQNKVIDGEEVNATSVSMQKHYEVINYISEIGLYPFLSMAVMSNATIERLPEGYFELIRATFAETDRWYMEEGIYEWDGRCRQDCMDHGVEFNTISDKDAWLELLTPLYDKKAAEDPMYAAFIEKALSLQ